MNKQLKKLISIFLIEIIILFPIAIVDAMTISEIKAEEISQTSAKINWQTSQNAEGKVNFGQTTALGETASSPNFVKNHTILLNSLTENKQYYFEVLSKNETAEITDNNNNTFYSFSTPPTGPLFINASIPDYITKRRYDILGQSRRFALIDMYVNNNAPRTLAAGAAGNFVFPDVSLNEGNNTIRFDVKDGSEVLQRTYTPQVDSITPTITLSEIPDVVSERLTIDGAVSEKVTMNFYVTTAEDDFTPPPKVTGLINTSIEANIVDFTWDEMNLSDFLKYIVYRDNKPISLINDKKYNDYSDAFVNSNQTYIYEVAAMDKKGNIGERSAQLAVTTLEGGVKNRPEPDEVDIHEGESELQKTITTNSTFKEELDIGTEDGFYNIKIEAADTAGNTWSYNKDVLLDTKPPEIEILSPKSNAEIYENYADAVNIRGKTEPGARVYLYVKRTPLGEFNRTYDVSGLADEIQDIPESDLRAGCTFIVLGEDQCKTHSDYEAVADAEGNFEFENVDLTSMWAGAMRITEYPTGQAYIDAIDRNKLKDFMESNLVFVGVDAAGKKGMETASYRIVTCWSGDMTWSSAPLPQYQSPTFLSIERLKEGSEAIYFYLNFTYHGQGSEGRVTNIYLTKACGTGYLETQKRYEHSCSILGSCTAKLSPSGKTVYVACPLRMIDGIEKWTDKDWKSFVEGVKNEMTFPFKITLSYDETLENKTVQRQKEHTLCTEVGYVVDATYINPKDVLPDWLLYDLVDFLNSSITTLNEWILRIREILQWVAIGCVITILIKMVVQIYRRITCHYDQFFKKLKDLGGSSQSGGSQEEDKCKACIQNDPKASKAFGSGKDFQDSISDTCLKVCYPSCSAAWDSEAALYKTYRFACDRTFGHPTPSGWTETLSDTDLFQKASQGSGCANDQSVRGRPLRAVQCKSLEEKYRIKGTFSLDDKCVEIISTAGGKRTETLYHIDGPYSEGEQVYKISKADTSAPSLTYDWIIKQNEDNYLTYLEQTCEEICTKQSKDMVDVGTMTTSTGKTIKVGSDIGKPVQSTKGNEISSKALDTAPKKNYVVTYGCLTPNQCISYLSKDAEKLKTDKGDETVDVKTAVPMGYTSNCFDPKTVSGDPDKRIECCCINSETGAMPEYYQPADVESKNTQSADQFTPASSYDDMLWSYRYWKVGYVAPSGAVKYNENRYIEGRDYTACFGQNDWLYDGTTAAGTVGNLLIIDPMKNHLAAFQCIAISQILNRLMLLKNIMVALENCLLSIRTSGRADTGVCKEIFSQYICAFIWKIIVWISDGCLPFGSGVDFTKSENSVLEAVSVGMKGVFDSVGDTQNELASEYGNAQLNNLLGLGQEDIFRKVCLMAFGYDWEIGLDSIIDIAYNTPYATLVQAMLPSREFLTFDPTNYKAKYEYRGSWLINPGCDLDSYQVYLACVTRDDMRKNGDINCAGQKDPYGKNCDCLDLAIDKAPAPMSFYQSQSKIPKNQLVQVDSTQITDRIKTSSYRYDHLKFVLNVDRNMAANKGDTTKCFPEGHEDGVFYFPITDYTAREIAGCVLDAASGMFSCQGGASFFYEQGNAYFTEITLNNNPSITDISNPDKVKIGATYWAGSSESISGTVKYSKDDRKQCLIMRLMEKDLTTIVKAPAPIELKKGFTEGQENLGMIYTITDKDLSGGSSAGLIINYEDEKTGEPRTAIGSKLSVIIMKNPVRAGGGTLEFHDDDSSKGISFSKTSTDSYTYGSTSKIQIKDCYVNNDGCEIELSDIGAKIKVKGITGTTQANPARYLFSVISTGGTSGTGSLGARYYLHMDLRYPVNQDSSCQEVMTQGFDESNVIVSNGIRQSVDIPIYVMPGERNIEKCASNDERSEIRITNENGEKIKQTDFCVCGTGATKNCPKENYDFCYGRCRQFPRCDFANPLTAKCVCDPSTPADKFDCGDAQTTESTFTESTRAGWYCYEDSSKIARCQQAAPTAQQVNQGDTTPLIVNIIEPYTSQRYNPGDTINVKVNVQDDKPDGKETCIINIQNTGVNIATNINSDPNWIIDYAYRIPDTTPKPSLITLKTVCTDNSMVSGKKTVESNPPTTVNIN
ncbi:MAG: hypothetical protein KJ561_04530 [Nanoarchaeota archaeon]|nr:hypothetical protein [Nanoarchaeota archaeon]